MQERIDALGHILLVRHLAVIESHKALKAAHIDHAEKLDKLLAKLDPETPGSLVAIEDMLNPTTPTGIGEIIKRLDQPSGYCL